MFLRLLRFAFQYLNQCEYEYKGNLDTKLNIYKKTSLWHCKKPEIRCISIYNTKFKPIWRICWRISNDRNLNQTVINMSDHSINTFINNCSVGRSVRFPSFSSAYAIFECLAPVWFRPTQAAQVQIIVLNFSYSRVYPQQSFWWCVMKLVKS